MARLYALNEVIAFMDIPLPEYDDLSEDEFEGYIEDDGNSNGDNDGGGQDDEREDGDGGGNSVNDRGGREDGGENGGDNACGCDDNSSENSDDDPTLPEYTQQPHCTQDMTNKSPLDFFQLFITDSILETVVAQTNLFAQQYLDSHELKQRSRVQQWVKSPHNMAELRKFLALIIIMGLISYPSIEDYWVTSWPFAISTFSSIMSRDRFSLLLRFLHLNDSTKYIPKGEPGYDPLYKLRPFVDPLIANFKAAFTLGRELSVDEGMIGFKGRLWFLQYMPKKPTKWGMKAFVLADSATGYTYNWKLYTGNFSKIGLGNTYYHLYITLSMLCIMVY